MKISQDVREYAASRGIGDVDVAIEQGMSDKSAEFVEQGTEIYRKI
jgi:phosphomethylpyrimidine synthase